MNSLTELFNRQRNPQMRIASMMFVFLHWLMAWKCVEGYYDNYVPKYLNIHLAGLDSQTLIDSVNRKILVQ